MNKTAMKLRALRAAQGLVPLLAALFATLLNVAVAVAVTVPPLQTGEHLHAEAMALFRQGRLPDAYGRLVALAEAGHPPSARVALWMCEHGRSRLGHDWDCAPHQIEQWAALGGVALPAIGVQAYPADPHQAPRSRR
jgi:hypothetical protein